MLGATLVIYGFSYASSNTSLYDPAWCLLPLATVVGWMATSPGLAACASPRAWYALAALVSFFVVAVFCISFASSAFATPEALLSLIHI
mgnify:CR=1 FL=1